MALVFRLSFLDNVDLGHVESIHAWLSRLPFPMLLDTLREGGVRPPLYFWLLKGWGALISHEAWLRLFSVALSTASVWLTYLAASRLFCWRTGMVSAGLCAFSPLLALSTGTRIYPYGLDVFLGGLILLTFITLLREPDLKRGVFHGLVLTAGLYTNFSLVYLLLMEGLFLILFFRVFAASLLRWGVGALLALLLFLPWMPALPMQMQRTGRPDDLITGETGLRINCLLTELSLGRLFAWDPLTPVVSLTPPPLDGEEAAQPGSRDAEQGGGHEGLQAMQMVFFGSFIMLAVIGLFAALKVSAWPVPGRLNTKTRVLKALACRTRGDGAALTAKKGAMLLLLFFMGPVLLSLAAHGLWGWTFEGSDLLFIALPFLMLVARGIGALEWRVMFYCALGAIFLCNLIFSFFSRDLCEATQGAKEGAAFLVDRVEGTVGGVCIHDDGMSYFPLLFYSRGRLGPVSFIVGEKEPSQQGGAFLGREKYVLRDKDLPSLDWIWRIEMDPPPGSGYAGAFDSPDETGRGLDLYSSWRKSEVRRFGNLLLTKYEKE